MPSMFDSRKFKAATLAAAVILVVIAGGLVLAILGKATYSEWLDLVKYALGSIAVVTGVFVAAVGYEDGQAKSVGQTIAAGGDVTVGKVTPPSRADTPITMKVESIKPNAGFVEKRVLSGLTSVILVSGIMFMCCAPIVVQGCTQKQANTVQDVANAALSFTQIACIFASDLENVPAIKSACGIADRVDPRQMDVLIQSLVAQRKAASKAGVHWSLGLDAGASAAVEAGAP